VAKGLATVTEVSGEAGLEVFGEEEAAAGFGGGCENDGVPEAQAMANCEFDGTQSTGKEVSATGKTLHQLRIATRACAGVRLALRTRT
jgi:di/tripeptidase